MSWVKQKVFLKFLKKIIIKKPIQNSKPAKANKKNDVDVNEISSIVMPIKIVNVYNNTQTISEYNTIAIKFTEFKRKFSIITQKTKVIKLIPFNNKNFKINQVYSSIKVVVVETIWSSKKL